MHYLIVKYQWDLRKLSLESGKGIENICKLFAYQGFGLKGLPLLSSSDRLSGGCNVNNL